MAAAEDGSALDHGCELAHVARPRGATERVELARRRGERRPRETYTRGVREVQRERRNVSRSVAQRRDPDGDGTDPVPQIQAKRAIRAHCTEIAMGRCDHTDRSAQHLRAADAGERSLLEDTEETDLRGQRFIMLRDARDGVTWKAVAIHVE